MRGSSLRAHAADAAGLRSLWSFEAISAQRQAGQTAQSAPVVVETQLAPCLRPGEVVILDNLNVHESPRAAKTLAEHGAWDGRSNVIPL